MPSMEDTKQIGQLIPRICSPEEIRKTLIDEARTWLGTPWKHNQRVKGHGIDCVNFLHEIASVSGIELPAIPKRYTRNVVGNSISSYLSQVFKPITLAQCQSGDILVFHWGNTGHHVGIVTGTTPCITFIHADNSLGSVVEQNLDTVLLTRLIEQYSLCDLL